MPMFQKSVLNAIKQDESLVALRWAEYQKYLEKIDFIKNVKEEKYQDGFLHDIFENCFLAPMLCLGVYKENLDII